MKKMIAVLLMLLFSCSALADAPLGGWTATDAVSLVMPEEATAAFEKAMDGLLGVNYTPVALLAKQVVSGTNYCFLCEAKVVAPGAEGVYCLVYVYQDLQGNASILDVEDLEFDIDDDDDDEDDDDDDESALGGWQICENEPSALAEDADAALEKALEGLVGAAYVPVVELGRQLVSGTNYCILCAVTPVTPDAMAHYAQVYVYQDLQGNAKILSVDDVEIGVDPD